MEFGGNKVSVDKPRSLGMWVLIGLSILSLIVMLSLIIYVGKDSRRLAGVMPEFEEALEKKDYAKALSMYRKMNDIIINRDPGDDSDFTGEYPYRGKNPE